MIFYSKDMRDNSIKRTHLSILLLKTENYIKTAENSSDNSFHSRFKKNTPAYYFIYLCCN